MMCMHEIAAEIFFEGEDPNHGNIQMDRVHNSDSFSNATMDGEEQDSMEEDDCAIYMGVMKIYLIKYH